MRPLSTPGSTSLTALSVSKGHSLLPIPRSLPVAARMFFLLVTHHWSLVTAFLFLLLTCHLSLVTALCRAQIITTVAGTGGSLCIAHIVVSG